MSTLVMGCDPHLDTVSVAIVDGVGRETATLRVVNGPDGWEQVRVTAQQWGVDRVGIEGASGYGLGLSRHLTVAGVEVLEIPTRLTSRLRRSDGAGKTDPGDARTIARAVIRGEGHLWRYDPGLEQIRLLSVRRDQLVSVQTAEINRLRALLAGIDPQLAATCARIRSRSALAALTGFDIPHPDPYQQTTVRLIQEIASDCHTRLGQIRQLETDLTGVMPPTGRALISQHVGCGVVTAAQLLTQLSGTDWFRTEAAMAAWAGTAPLDASSGRQQRHRLNPGGNRQANRAIHTIITTQLAQHGEAHHYVTRRIQEGKTRREAIRAAKRHLTRRIWKTLHTTQLT